jgi:hypothetical protein
MNTINLSDGRALVCSLFAHRSIDAPVSKPWRLIWAEGPDACTYTSAEGECSAKHFRTMRDAIAYGRWRYGETARRFS